MCFIFVMNLASWNVIGLGNPDKLPKVRKFIIYKNLDWVGLTETKLINCDRFLANRIWDCPSICFIYCNTLSNHSGGLLAMWNNDVFQVKKRHRGSRWLMMEGFIVNENWEGSISLVYSSCDDEGRNLVYSEITVILSTLNVHVCLYETLMR